MVAARQGSWRRRWEDVRAGGGRGWGWARLRYAGEGGCWRAVPVTGLYGLVIAGSDSTAAQQQQSSRAGRDGYQVGGIAADMSGHSTAGDRREVWHGCGRVLSSVCRRGRRGCVVRYVWMTKPARIVWHARVGMMCVGDQRWICRTKLRHRLVGDLWRHGIPCQMREAPSKTPSRRRRPQPSFTLVCACVLSRISWLA